MAAMGCTTTSLAETNRVAWQHFATVWTAPGYDGGKRPLVPVANAAWAGPDVALGIFRLPEAGPHALRRQKQIVVFLAVRPGSSRTRETCSGP
jgi:hypothetical protein